MRRLHLWAGALGVVVFLVTGQLMRYHAPPMDTLSEGIRLMHRSRHIYILASGLVNLMLGLYMQRSGAGWRRAARTVGSLLLLVSLGLLTVAFAVESDRGFRPDLMWSHLGLYALFGGCMAHLASSIDVPRN